MRSSLRALSLLTLALASAGAWAAPQTYVLDPTHTQVQFTYSHFGFSNITGRFDDIQGTLVFDAQDPGQSKVDVVMAIASIDTGVDKLDEHLRGGDFFDAKTFPQARFVSEHVMRKGDHWVIHGTLELKGQRRPVELHATLNGQGEHPMAKVPAIGFDAKGALKRSDFGLGAYAPAVSDAVQLRITVEATQPSKPTP